MSTLMASNANVQDVFNNPALLERASGALLATKLFYQLRPSTKPILKNRRTVTYQSDRNDYNQNKVIIFEINGQEMMDCSNSYISFKMLPKYKSMHLNKGSTARLIANWKVSGFGGVPLEEFSEVGLFQELMEKNSCDPGWLATVGQAHGWYDGTVAASGIIADDAAYFGLFDAQLTGAGNDTDQIGVNGATNSQMTNWIWDLSFSGVFGHIQQYIPLMKTGTIRIEITLNNADVAFCDIGHMVHDGVRDYSIKEAVFVADVVSLSDDVNRAITELTNDGKLLLSYPTVNVNSVNIPASDNNTTINLSRAVTDVRGVYSVVRDNRRIASSTYDSFKSVAAACVTEWQVVLGVDYYPVRAINDVVNSYLYSSVRGFNRGINNHSLPALSLSEYKAERHHMSVDLELDPTSSQTGANTRNGNTLQLRLKCLTTANTYDFLKTVTSFLVYTRIINVLPNAQIAINE